MIVRWEYEITYRCAKTKGNPKGERKATGILEEIEDLQDIVERGPHFDTVKGIKIKRVGHITSRSLTVQQAARM